MIFSINSDIIKLKIKNIDKIIFAIASSVSITKNGQRLFVIVKSTQQACNLNAQQVTKALGRLKEAGLIDSFKYDKQHQRWAGTLPVKQQIEVKNVVKEETTKLSPKKNVREVIDYLNKKAGKNFRVSKKAQQLISQRFNEGYNVQDMKQVIDVKCEQWKDNERMNQYLRPQTLFSGKFDNYMSETRDKKTQKVDKQDKSDKESWFS